jgi:hypothetical protein
MAMGAMAMSANGRERVVDTLRIVQRGVPALRPITTATPAAQVAVFRRPADGHERTLRASDALGRALARLEAVDGRRAS